MRALSLSDSIPRPAHRRVGKHSDEGNDLSVPEGLAALSLDALSSVAYGPQAMIIVLLAAGTSALRLTVPLTLVIIGMLALLVVSYSQVIAANPDGGGAYAVAKKEIGRRIALLAAAALVVDYVLTVAVSLAAGAASLGSVFPSLADHLLPVSLIGLVLLTIVNMFGITSSARFLMPPMAVFIASIFAALIFGAFHPDPVAVIGQKTAVHATEALGVILVLKAFAAGCSAVTGVEAIANGVPAFRKPRVRTAQRTELVLGVLLGVMLIGLVVLVRAHDVLPRGNVTILAQVFAGAFGTGWPFYVSTLAVAIVLGLAANTSFGGLPVLMSLLAKDDRLPHLFYLRAERPVYRVGIVVLAILAGLLLAAVNAGTQRLIPLFTIGVFVGFTISQIGLVRHWRRTRPPRWRARAILNGAGAVMTAIAVVVFLGTKFLAGAWIVVITVPILMLLFSRTERYYGRVSEELRIGKTPDAPRKRESIVIVPTVRVSALTERALSAAMSLGETVVAVSVAGDEDDKRRIEKEWGTWHSAVPIEVIVDPHRSLVHSVLGYVDSLPKEDLTVTVLVPTVVPDKRSREIFHNQRGRLLEAALEARTDVIVATFPFHSEA